MGRSKRQNLSAKKDDQLKNQRRESADSSFFKQPDDRRQFALEVEGTRLYVNRDYLACLSPVFNKIFFGGGFQPSPLGECMPMKDKSLVDFLDFLHSVCPTPQMDEIDDENVGVLLSYADEYDVASLRQRCEAFLTTRVGMAKQGKLSTQLLVDYLGLVHTYRLPQFTPQLVPLVAQLSFETIKASHDKLPSSVLAAVYQAQLLHARAELDKPHSYFACDRCNKECVVEEQRSACCTGGLFVKRKRLSDAFLCGKTSCRKRCTVKANGGSLCCNSAVTIDTTVTGLQCSQCKDEPKVGGSASDKCVCRFADFSANLLDKKD